MTEEALKRWDNSLTAIEDLYRDVERRSLSLPVFSLAPMIIALWNSIKFGLFLFLDILLLLPINAVILIRNIFPGRWRYRSFSGKYWKYVLAWLWRGEVPLSPFGVIRPLVDFMVTVHAHSRIRILSKYIELDDGLTKDDRSQLGARVTSMLEHWKRPKGLDVVYSYVLPITGPIIEGFRFIFPGQFPKWAGFLGLLLISYTIIFVISAFMVKRALMLGASGRSLYFPGAIVGTQCYGKESEILDSLGIKKKEFPFDITLNFLSLTISYLSVYAWFRLYESVGLAMPPTEQFITQMLIQGVVFVALNCLVLYRRKVTGRS